ncbi:hypothetical protein [Nonomuraea bangladeshensis]|uniref:hypothetical protein n=1 Tax=Nonomuraea bangladeshensis TaxID=404385 RepID=UPI003C2E3C51
MTEQRTWTIGGVTYTASLEEKKARRLRNAFDPDQPRDRKGRWIETGASVSIWGGGSGTVARNLGGGRLEVHTADGRKLAVHRNYLTVTAAPGGKKPSGDPSDRPRPLRAAKPSKDVEEFVPDAQDTRVPVSELKPGQLALVYGWDQLGADTYDIGRISSVSPAGPAEDADTKPSTGWAVTFKHDNDRHWTMYANDDAVARVVPEEEFAPLVEAERSGDQAEADRIALGIYDRIMAGDDAEAAATPEAGPPAQDPAEGPDGSSPSRGGEAPGDVEQQIIDAHHRIAPPDPDGEPQWVSMERLRAGLPEQDRAEVDEALRRMAAEGKVSLAPEADQKTLTDSQRAAAVEQGGVPKHLVAVIEQVERRREPSRNEQADAAAAEPSIDDLRPRQWITTAAFADPVRVEQIQDTLTGTEVEVTTIRGDRRTLPEEELGDWQLADEPPNHRADGAPVAPETRPQEGLFSDMGTDKDGNRDIFMDLEDDAPSEADPAAAETPPDEPAQSAELENVEARLAAIEETQLAYFGRDIGSGGRATYGTIVTHGGPQGDAAYQEARDGTREELAAIPASDQVAFDRAASRALAGIYNSEVYPGSVWGISGVIGKSVAVRQEMRRRGYPGPSLDYVDGTRVFQQLDEQYPDPNEVMDMGTFSWEVPDDLPERLAALNDEQLRGFTDMANLATVREDINSHAYYQALSLAVEERERRARAGQSHTPTPAEPGNIETLRARAQQEQQELNEQFVAEMVAEHGLTDQARDLLAGALAESPSSRKWYRRVLAADDGRVPNWAENVVRIVARPDIGQSEEGRAATSRVFRATRSLSRGDGRQDDSARRDIESAFEILGEEPYRGDEDSTSARRPSSPSPAAQEAQPGQASGESAVPDISPARQQQLADLIEEQAARYVPTGGPGRYLSEVAGEQGVPRPGEREWIDAYLRDHPEVLTATGEERGARQQERAQQREADAARAKTLSRQARAAFDEGRFDEALELLDQAEDADPNGRDWNRVREVIRQGQADAEQGAAPPAPDAGAEQAEQPAQDETPREPAPDGQAYADEIQVGDTLAEAQWRVAGPEAGVLRTGEAAYANPAGPARLGEPERDSRRVTDIQQADGGRLTFTFDDGTRISRRPDALVTRGTPPDVEGGEDIPQGNAQTGDRIRFGTAGPKLPAGLDRQALGIGQFDQVTVTGRISRRQPGMPSVVLDDVVITRADGTTAAAPDGTRFSVPRRVTRLDDSEPAPQPEQVPGAGLREGDRIVGPTGEVSVERVEQLDDALVSALVRDGDDRRERHLIASDRPVQLAAGGGDQVDEVEASGLAVGEWVVIDDAAVQVASVPAIEDGRARFDVRDQDGRLSEMELDERLLLARVTGSPARPPEAPPGPPAEPERVTAVDLPDGTPTGRVRLRTDQRRRLLDLNLDATGSGAPPEVAQAAARLRARRELSAEQMQALAAHLRSLAADENTPAARRRALARTAGWVEAANARLEGFPPPPHDPGRPGPERTFARNLAMGDVIAMPGDDGSVRFGTVTATRPVKGFGLHTVHIRHEDGSVEQRVLPDGVDLWLMPDLPEDEPVRPPQFTREHVTADRIGVGDTIRWDGSDFADPVVGQVLSVQRRGGEFAETRLYEMTVLDGDDEQRTITVTDRGWPSVERLDRGPATSGQPYDSVMQPETAEYVGWRDLKVGDRAHVMMATGTITAITRHPANGDVPEGATVRVMADSGDERTVSVFDDPDMPDDYIDPSVMRLIPADDNAAARIAAVRREREQISREREFTAFLAELETTRSRWAATDVAQAMRELPAGSGRDEALAAALERLDRIDTMDDTAAATLAFRLGARDDTQAAAMASATSAVTGAVKKRATSRIRAALEGADLLGGETWPRALARVAAAYRDHPPAPGVLPAGVSLARLRDRLDGTPERPASRLPDMPQDADLPARLAGYRAQLPEDLADLGRQPVSRTVFEPTTLEDLEAGRVPAVQQVTLWAPDIADDDGPGPEAMRQLAVLRTAGADLDVRFRQHLAGRADALGAELDAVTRERGQAWKTADDLDAEIARVRRAGGTPDEALLGQRDDTAARWQEAAAREQELRRLLAEARREALAATLAEVRQVGGDGLDYIDRNGRPLTGRAGSNAAALRYVEEVLPADWLAAARQAGPVEVVTGPGQHVHVRADGSTRISLPADDNTAIAPAIRDGQPGRVPVPSAQPGGVPKATVAAHELGHHLEATVPGLREAGRALLWDRTSHGPVGERVRPEPMVGEDRGRPFEIYPGDFPDARTGRVNGDGTQEVFANVLESLAGGGDYADDDLRHWGLGVLALLATDPAGPQGGARRDEGAERRDPLDGVNLLALSDEQLRALLARIDDPQAVARLRAVLDEREQRRTGRDDIDLTELSDAELESMLLAGWDGYGDDPERTALQDRVIAETEAREAERRRRGDDLGDLAASDLLSMDTDDLAALYGRNLGRYGMDPAVTSLLDQISAELEERDRRRDVGADPYAGMDLEGMSEEQLAELIERHQPLYHSDPWSGALVRRVIAELDERDRRQQPEDDRTPEEMRIDDLIAQNWEPRDAYAEVYGLSEEEMDRQERLAVIDAERGAGERREQVVRRMYRQWVYEQALEAERATNGYMLSPLGRRAGKDPKDLWGGNADHAYAYASEELKRWWADQPNGGRMTYDEWRAQWLGDSRDRRQTRERRQTAGNGRDFG